MLRPVRLPLPEKITSSISAPRIFFDELSPITQRKASTRLDLPQPFGPTMPVSPGSIRKSVEFGKRFEAGNMKFFKFHRRARLSLSSILSWRPMPDMRPITGKGTRERKARRCFFCAQRRPGSVRRSPGR